MVLGKKNSTCLTNWVLQPPPTWTVALCASGCLGGDFRSFPNEKNMRLPETPETPENAKLGDVRGARTTHHPPTSLLADVCVKNCWTNISHALKGASIEERVFAKFV